VIDGRWSTVGSSNIDPFSLLVAREANVAIDDREFAAALRASLHHALEEGAWLIRPQAWHALPLLLRLRIWLAYGLSRLLIGLAGYGGLQ
jgi:cardiolipin synthase